MLVGNAIVGQSGGPTSAINATLSGIIRGASSCSSIKKLYGMKNGIEGFLQGNIIDLSYLSNNEEQLSLLESTPASALGSCRKRIPSVKEDITIYQRIFDIFKRNDIRYFFYIGGNDSMDTVSKISEYSKMCDYKINVIGIPKTIDNDLVITDHTPGFGSAAKYISTTVQEIARDTACYLCNAVTIIEIMGRDSGWLTASAGLPKHFGNDGADLIYLPEKPFSIDKFKADVKSVVDKNRVCIVAVSEGIKNAEGKYVGEDSSATDVFGHTSLGGVCGVLKAAVKSMNLKCKAIELNILQRCASHCASLTDIEESYESGRQAVIHAVNGEADKMIAFKRVEGKDYAVECVGLDLSTIANAEKAVPLEWITPDGTGLTEEFINYALPLIQGEPKPRMKDGLPAFAKLKMIPFKL